jgi:acyl-coenzyme A synthetase/AMP-(fatty) acid ligase
MALILSSWLDGRASDRPCLIDDVSSCWISYHDLARKVELHAQIFAGQKRLAFVFVHNDIESVAVTLGAISAGHAVALLDPALTEESRRILIERYKPEFLIDVRKEVTVQRTFGRGTNTPIDPELSILLSTSGSTGSPKFVRLGLAAMLANAEAIAEVLEIEESDVAAGHLPLHYSFGLSTLTSHLVRGARVRLTELGLLDKGFWPAMRDAEITHLPGVPFHFKTLERMRYDRIALPSLKSLAQAGGFLDIESRRVAYKYMAARGGRFYVMYGQTEAAPRMTTLPPAEFEEAPGSVGRALPQGKIEIVDPDVNGHGEVIYRGPNVMMGYAESRLDLSRSDENRGLLATGDIGFLDSNGRLTLTGRAKRFGKIHGLRVNLDEVEKLANTVCDAAVVQSGDEIKVYLCNTRDPKIEPELKNLLMSAFKAHYTLHPTSIRISFVETIPRTERGKIDYRALERRQ